MSPIMFIRDILSPYIVARLGIKDDRGASLVEYALLVALIAVVCIVAIQFLGSNASTKLDRAGSAVGS